jgi:hypothetical protein
MHVSSDHAIYTAIASTHKSTFSPCDFSCSLKIEASHVDDSNWPEFIILFHLYFFYKKRRKLRIRFLHCLTGIAHDDEVGNAFNLDIYV